jgi:RNA-directed DNA polymerase
VFDLGGLAHLSRVLCVEERLIKEVLDDFDTNPDSLVHELTLWPADPNKKPRDVIAVRGRWRMLQRRLYLKLFLPRMAASAFSHGGVRGRSPATNARAHRGNAYAFVTDVSGFFPSISCGRLNKFFLRQACSYEVARVLTRLCTYDFHLALGLVTSPILANGLFKPIDTCIANVCRKMKLTYTRFVDDITISGKFDLEPSGIRGVVENIVERHGFKLVADPKKTHCGSLDRDITITGVRLKKYHLDAPKKYVQELERLIADHASLAQGGEFTGPLLMESELFGKSHFVCALNPGRRRSILGKLKAIEWDKVMKNAEARSLVRRQNRLQPRGGERPDYLEELPQVVAERRFREYVQEHPQAAAVDQGEAPF